jgi:CRISPR-associated protein Cas1
MIRSGHFGNVDDRESMPRSNSARISNISGRMIFAYFACRAASSSVDLETDDTDWAMRSNMWQARVKKASGRRTKRAKPPPAIILAGHGVSLRVENGALTIQNGFTHYPQQREITRYFRGDVALPERIILLDGSGSISFDVLSWLAEQKISFIRIDWKGDIVSVGSTTGYSANPFRVRWQLARIMHGRLANVA